jgi:hypothetical protein
MARRRLIAASLLILRFIVKRLVGDPAKHVRKGDPSRGRVCHEVIIFI